MSLRSRIAATAALAVAVAVVLVSMAAYAASSRSLRAEVDRDLAEAAAELRDRPDPILLGFIQLIDRELSDDPRFESERRRSGFGALPADRFGGATAFAQVVDAAGNLVSLAGDLEVPSDYDYLPISDDVVALAGGRLEESFYETVDVEGASVRIRTEQLLPGLAMQVARPLDEVEESLDRLAILLGLGSVAGVALAAALGLVVARLAIRPVEALTASAEHVAATKDLSHRFARSSDDELGRLGASFNTMLEALESSEDARRQLVADASHELRTPLTSLRTNIEVLADAQSLGEADRTGLVGDVVEQLDELNLLVTDLIDAARENEPAEEIALVDVGAMIRDAVERSERNYPGVAFSVDIEPFEVLGVPTRLGRAIGNLLDNASKWSPPSGTVEVKAADGTITVRDHGPGIDPADLPHVFERFYRSAEARSMPGSGLGLAIVARVAETHGGSVHAANHPDGGAVVTLRLPPGKPISGGS